MRKQSLSTTARATLIRAAGLPAELADKLDPSVRDRYRELWNAAQVPRDLERE